MLEAREAFSHHRLSLLCVEVVQGKAEVVVAPSTLRSQKAREKVRMASLAEATKAGQKIWRCDVRGCLYAYAARVGVNYSKSIAAHKASHTKAGGGRSVRQVDMSVCCGFETGGEDEESEEFESVVIGAEHTIASERDEFQHEREEYFDALLSPSPGQNSIGEESDSSLAEVDCVQTILTLESVRQDVYQHQQKIELILRNPLDDTRGGKNVDANLALYTLGLNLGLSKKDGQLLLDYCNKWVKIDDGEMFKRWKGLKTAIRRKLERHCDVHVVNIPLPEQFFGTKDFVGHELKPVKCWYYPILDRIGHACLDIDPKDLCKTFDEELIQSSIERIYSTFPTAQLFERFSMHTNKMYGTGLVTMVVGVFFDEANATGSRSANPLVAFLLNVIGDSFRPIFIGYCPLSLPYSNAFLRKLLLSKVLPSAKKKQNGGLTKELCTDIIRFAKRSALQQFLKFVLTPLFVSDPIRLQIGLDKGEESHLLANKLLQSYTSEIRWEIPKHFTTRDQ